MSEYDNLRNELVELLDELYVNDLGDNPDIYNIVESIDIEIPDDTDTLLSMLRESPWLWDVGIDADVEQTPYRVLCVAILESLEEDLYDAAHDIELDIHKSQQEGLDLLEALYLDNDKYEEEDTILIEHYLNMYSTESMREILHEYSIEPAIWSAFYKEEDCGS